MKHAVVFAHPNPASLTAQAAGAYVEAARALGHEVLLRDLYAMGFDPCLKTGEIPGPAGFAPADDVVAERARLAGVDVFALVYPLWFNAPPAILKGYIDRVFGMGFGYGPTAGGTEPLLEGRKLISVSLSGAPDSWVRETGALQALATLFDQHLAHMCGFAVLDHLHFGDVTPGITEDAVADILAAVRQAVAAQFGASAPYVVA
jgi:NAD(P)H dehydrogenase (quinone)